MIVCLSYVDHRGAAQHTYNCGAIEVALNYDQKRLEKWLNDEWAKWKRQVLMPESNTEFASWLEEQHPAVVKRINDVMHHTFS